MRTYAVIHSLSLLILDRGSSFTLPVSSFPTRTFLHDNVLRMNAVDMDKLDSMRVGELKGELESLGISTKSFFEKKELVEALAKARSEGRKPRKPTSNETQKAETINNDLSSREEKIAKEMEACKAMKASALKAELESLGKSTKTFFEKSEFVKALAEARVDGIKKSQKVGEGYAEYTDVEVLPADGPGPKSPNKSDDQQGNAQAQSSPFGGGFSEMFGGMGGGGGGGGSSSPGGFGGMNIEDLMKNMGGMGGGGMPNIADMFGGGSGNPFGGVGGNPFGGGASMPDMGKVQTMMSNPKVREIISKAQSNPRVMSAITECMSNPMAMAKYKSDPEISKILNELQKYI